MALNKKMRVFTWPNFYKAGFFLFSYIPKAEMRNASSVKGIRTSCHHNKRAAAWGMQRMLTGWPNRWRDVLNQSTITKKNLFLCVFSCVSQVHLCTRNPTTVTETRLNDESPANNIKNTRKRIEFSIRIYCEWFKNTIRILRWFLQNTCKITSSRMITFKSDWRKKVEKSKTIF